MNTPTLHYIKNQLEENRKEIRYYEDQVSTNQKRVDDRKKQVELLLEDLAKLGGTDDGL